MLKEFYLLFIVVFLSGCVQVNDNSFTTSTSIQTTTTLRQPFICSGNTDCYDRFSSCHYQCEEGICNQIQTLVALPDYPDCDKSTGNSIELTGFLHLYNSAKSYLSYCAGGSEYVIIDTFNNTTHVLEYDSSLIEFNGMKVLIQGLEKTKSIPCPKNSQCPVPADWDSNSPEPDYNCTIIDVEKIIVTEVE